MKILAIKIKNLASLEGTNEINFTEEPLVSAGIFAITGPTGSGKSTLLDALCLALFAKTPRHENTNSIRIQDVGNDTISQGDVRGILSKGCTDGFAEVQFIGIDNNIHKSKWTVRRAHNRVTASLQPDTLELTNITTNTVFPETRKTVILKELERLVGLNFVQFTRSVLLAQGEFTAFLKADNDQKSSLLEKLTGTDIYSEISKNIYIKYKEAEDEYKQLQIKMQAIELLTAEEVIQFKEQTKGFTDKLLIYELELLKLEEDIKWHTNLARLTSYKIEADVILQQSTNEKLAAQDRVELFNLIESAQPARDMLASKSNLKIQADNTIAEINNLQITIDAWNIDHTTAIVSLTTATDILITDEMAFQQAVPLIAAAKVLDTKIEEKNGQVIEAANYAKDAAFNMQNHEVIINNKKIEIQTTSADIEKTVQWKNSNELRKPIAENKSIINSKLDDAGMLLILEQKLNTALADTAQKLENGNKELEILKKKADLTLLSLNHHKAINEIDELKISDIKIQDIKATESSLRSQINEIAPASACWEILFNNQNDLITIEKKQSINTKDILNKKEKIDEKKIKLSEAEALQNLTEKILNDAILQTHKSVKEMRAQLSPETPCPVCGSKEHPFASIDPALNIVIENLKKEDILCKDSYKKLLVLCNTLHTEIQAIENECTHLEKDIVIKKNKIEEQINKWQGFKMNETCLAIPADDRLLWLREEENKLKKVHKETEQQIIAFQTLKDKIDNQKSEISKTEKILILTEQSLKDCEKDQQFLLNENKRFISELANCTQSITTITDHLNSHFNDKEWQIKWQKDPAGFIQKINEFAHDWNSNILSLQVSNANLQNLQTELIGLNSQLKIFENAAILTLQKYNSIKEDLSKIKQERDQIFNGEPINVVEQNLLHQIDVHKKCVIDRASEKDDLTTKLLKANSNKQHYENTMVKLTKELLAINLLINTWITEYNFKSLTILDETEINNLLSYSLIWITNERTSLSLIDEAITKATATVADRNLTLIRHSEQNIPLHPSDILSTMLTEVKNLISITRTESSSISFKLVQHNNNEARLGNLQIDTNIKKQIYENWYKLNDLIGSQDGKKFRQFAQEYTLDILLNFANIHLEDLATRYKLSRIPNTLSLQVLDSDMGDEIRSVHTLSGGESFLVSLALALGLASLSSNKMKVESLFIDEGFGSLDPATLSIAMDALTKLKDQGRKVGVISHVAEMTENILTQIKISKISNGRSKLEVV